MGENREEQRSLTGQKAEPLGMKFTLFLSGHEKRGKPFDLPDLKITEVTLRNVAFHFLLKTNPINLQLSQIAILQSPRPFFS